uniref:dnaJ homolog subfamily C member 8-like n=1 Tax=Styela clava TaxID=7725 RepID=UPI00193ADE5B|nr:dnaJ homolog subfamily C member 8-like [Styela clava]
MASTSSDPKAEDAFNTYMSEVKRIEAADSVLTPKQQIDRLNRPGSTYFNLNPYDVLQVTPETPLPDVKKKFRRLSILVHPDKNLEQKELAQKSFDAVKKAWELLNDDKEREKCLGVVSDAKVRLETILKEKRKKLKKEGKPAEIPEDDPHVYESELHKETCKLFADMAIVRKEMETREMNERKRKAQQEAEEKEKAKQQKEWDKNFEESRQGRVSSWQNFKKDKKKKKKDTRAPFKPPKVRMEER